MKRIIINTVMILSLIINGVLISNANDISSVVSLKSALSEVTKAIERDEQAINNMIKTLDKIEKGYCSKEDILFGIKYDETKSKDLYVRYTKDTENKIEGKREVLLKLEDMISMQEALFEYGGGVVSHIKKFENNNLLGEGTNKYSPPLDKYVITSGFGNRIHPIHKKEIFHNGIDLAAPMRTDIKSSESGIVILSKYLSGYGNTVIVMHKNNEYTMYAHIDYNGFMVKEGDTVNKGQVVGKVGSTGYSTGPHLHFEVFVGTARVNPISKVKL